MKTKAPKTFDDLFSIYERFDAPVYQDTSNDTLLVYDTTHFVWYRYRWTHGKREIKYLETLESELPIMVQIYPAL